MNERARPLNNLNLQWPFAYCAQNAGASFSIIAQPRAISSTMSEHAFAALHGGCVAGDTSSTNGTGVSGTAKATGGAGNSNALVGTPDQVAEALLAYIDLGVDIISARGYHTLQDAIDFGDQVIPLVRAEVGRRDRAVA